jgi:DoxX-like family
MQSATLTAARPKTKTQVRVGLVISAIPVLFLLFDSVIKLAVIEPVVVSMTQLGYPVSLAVTLGIIELACLALYVYPRTSLLGAVLLTGYLGGAVATHVRIGSPLLSHVLFPLYIAALLWGGLYLLDARLRALLAPTR